MSGEPQAIFFDLDGTIIDWGAGMDAHWRAACNAGGAIDGLALDALFDAVAARRTWFWSDPGRSSDGRMNLNVASAQIVQHALSDLGFDLPDTATAIANDYRARRDGALALYPGAIDVLAEVRSRRIATALITNGGAAHQRRSVERFGLASYFDCIVIEGEFGCGKPDERLFLHALTSSGAAPADAWMVGDNYEADIVTPHGLGMHTVWVDAASSGLPADAVVRPHRVIRAIGELLEG